MKTARPAPSPFHFINIEPFEQGQMIAEAMIARRLGAQLMLATSAAMTESSKESQGFLTAIQARLVGHD